jgi:hypothetical protein
VLLVLKKLCEAKIGLFDKKLKRHFFDLKKGLQLRFGGSLKMRLFSSSFFYK